MLQNIKGKLYHWIKLFIMQNCTGNANGDVPLTAENVWYF